MSKRLWKAPAWLAPYVPLIGNASGWITPEHAMNCDGRDCNIVVNGPRALICTSVSSQVSLLERLYAKGLLKEGVGTRG